MSRINRRGSPDSPVYEARTGDILVRVSPAYLPEDSNPENGRWIWSYTVEIENHGKDTVTLVSRHWVITDGLNRVEEVKGQGVVGEQPVLGPREAFRYASGCPLATPSGAMRGTYQMVTAKGEAFEAAIPEFSLHLPGARRRLN
ncbi:MAG: Co2+/Mg2+ efflux protein ApaG [Caulobacter sp.]|nr:Co2+/Mg2+ efflux protein ApaG [Caulobacter sp.]